MQSPSETTTEFDPTSDEAPEVFSQIVLTQRNNGFTIGLGLHSQNAAPGEMVTIPLVDIVAMAVADTLAKMPPEFKARLEAASAAVSNTQKAIEAGADPQEAARANLAQYGLQVHASQGSQA